MAYRGQRRAQRKMLCANMMMAAVFVQNVRARRHKMRFTTSIRVTAAAPGVLRRRAAASRARYTRAFIRCLMKRTDMMIRLSEDYR